MYISSTTASSTEKEEELRDITSDKQIIPYTIKQSIQYRERFRKKKMNKRVRREEKGI